jgi:uncharacterized GH25 family protein
MDEDNNEELEEPMDISFSIRVVDEDGNPVENARVTVIYSFTQQEDYTDEDGWVEFQRDTMFQTAISATIYVDGEEVGQELIEDGDTFSYTI